MVTLLTQLSSLFRRKVGVIFTVRWLFLAVLLKMLSKVNSFRKYGLNRDLCKIDNSHFKVQIAYNIEMETVP